MIADYIGTSRRTAVSAEHFDPPLPVRRLGGAGHPCVWAWADELDDWLAREPRRVSGSAA